uniref:Helicase ATP-binding domain-containing protein n=1 Tax=Myripristis murdjan TaxID=586833 RepID=A0A667Y4X7_9TELE
SSSFLPQAPLPPPSSGLICSKWPTPAAGSTCRDAGQGHKESPRSAHDASATPHTRCCTAQSQTRGLSPGLLGLAFCDQSLKSVSFLLCESSEFKISTEFEFCWNAWNAVVLGLWLDFLNHTTTAAKFRSVFKEFPFFNYVQSKALDDVLYTGKNFVACAPTGSGKTVLFELAIIRLLMETSEPWRDVKAVYMAPIKALCSQRFESWKQKFGPLGLNCKELTGDTEIDDFFEIQDAHIIMTTPEKWDSMTRKWKENCLLQLVRLFLIDEVHVVKDAIRGATLEVVVSRMKAVHAYRTAENPQPDLSMRFLALSATIPNISDVSG